MINDESESNGGSYNHCFVQLEKKCVKQCLGQLSLHSHFSAIYSLLFANYFLALIFLVFLHSCRNIWCTAESAYILFFKS